MKFINMVKSKIHRATITECDLNYVGSITIDSELLDAVDIIDGELVHVWNVDNGERLETYVIAGEKGSGVICLNGAAAHKAKVGDKVIICAFCLTDEPVEKKVIIVNESNKIVTRI